jgi:glutamate/tyrosine decarboxylase-like PLP-dependent enzyme
MTDDPGPPALGTASTRDLLQRAAEYGIDYLQTVDNRPIAATPAALAALDQLGGSLPDEPSDPAIVLAQLNDLGSPATLATAGGRFFGFVHGGALPVTVAAGWLATAWDQDAGIYVLSPVGAALEEIALGWIVDVLGLPPETAGGFVTGATMANFSALAAARHALLRRAGWDVEAQGMFGAPPIRVVAGDEIHVSVLKALALLGFGRERVVRVPVDDQGRIRADQMPPLDAQTIVCLQAGNVHTGAFDPAAEIGAAARAAGAWVHVDGAFGLWAAASPALAYLTRGLAEADSWALDAHKWLNVPYDSGIALVREGAHLRAAMATSAAYIEHGVQREPEHYTPELSRRARGVEIWAALRSLGRSGLAALIERNCRQAARIAERLRVAGYHVLNDVVLNQVLVSFGSPERTRRVIAAVQADGTCWCGGSVWQGHTAMRISVSSWATTDADVERSLDTILRVAAQETREPPT